MSAADTAISITQLAGRIAQFGESALPVAQFVAGFFPGAAPVLQIIQASLPVIRKITVAAPVVVEAIEAGRPIIDALQKSGPDVLPFIKQIYAIAVNGDPARPETSMTASDVSDKVAVAFAGPVLLGRDWDKNEEARFDTAKGNVSDA